MSTAQDRAAHSTPTRSCATALVCRKCDYSVALSEREAYCPRCNKSLDVDYDYELAGRRLREVPMAERPLNIWHLEELLPIVDAVGAVRVGEHSGYTPLIKADRLGAAVGLRNLYVKDDSTSRPSLSYKDRVVSMAVARLLELGEREIGCVSTGNVGTAVASLAAKAGVPAYVFYPNRLRARRRMRAARWARRSVSWRATTTKPTKPAARSRKRRGWSSRTSRCARSTRRARRRSRTRSSSSSAGARRITS